MAPLVQEIAVDVDAVGFRQVFGDQLADPGQVCLLVGAVVLHIAQLIVALFGIAIVAHGGRSRSLRRCGGGDDMHGILGCGTRNAECGGGRHRFHMPACAHGGR